MRKGQGRKNANQMNDFAIEDRKRWMGLLARADDERLTSLTQSLSFPNYAILRGPEQGLVMVRGAAGGSEQQFNLGEMTVTRCTVRTEQGTVGHSYVAGRAESKAETAAVLDAMLQDSSRNSEITRAVLAPLAKDEEQRRGDLEKKSAATKVDFMTMVRGE